MEEKRIVPIPVLGEDAYEDLVHWYLSVKKEVLPVERAILIQDNQEIYHTIYAFTKSVTGSVGLMIWGWCYLIMGWYPQLSHRSAQFIKQARNDSILEGMWGFFFELTQHTIEHVIEVNQLWNMDETGLANKKTYFKIIASKGLSNVW